MYENQKYDGLDSHYHDNSKCKDVNIGAFTEHFGLQSCECLHIVPVEPLTRLLYKRSPGELLAYELVKLKADFSVS